MSKDDQKWTFSRSNFLVGGWTNPPETQARQTGTLPQMGGENTKYLKPPGSFWWRHNKNYSGIKCANCTNTWILCHVTRIDGVVVGQDIHLQVLFMHSPKPWHRYDHLTNGNWHHANMLGWCRPQFVGEHKKLKRIHSSKRNSACMWVTNWHVETATTLLYSLYSLKHLQNACFYDNLVSKIEIYFRSRQFMFFLQPEDFFFILTLPSPSQTKLTKH